MESGAEAIYQKLCSEITAEFNECSKQVRIFIWVLLSLIDCLHNAVKDRAFDDDNAMQVREMESQFLTPEVGRADLAQLLGNIQTQEKQKLHLVSSHLLKSRCLNGWTKSFLLFSSLFFVLQTVTIQVLKKAGRPSERMLTHENCKFKKPMQHECVHLHEITEAAGTEEAEADAEFDNALKEAIRGVQDSVTCINEYLEDIRYEIEALEAE